MRRRTALVVLLLAAATACGLPDNGAPSRIDPSRVPFGLLSPQSTAASLPSAGPVAPLYFVANDRLVSRREHVATGTSVPEGGLRALLAGPTSADVKHGLTTAIPAQTRLVSLDVRGRHAFVDLTSQFAAVGGIDQVLAVGQIVLTLTATPQISAVSFAIDGQPAEVPNGRGSQSLGPHTARDYATIVR